MSKHLDRSFDTPEPIDLYVENGRGLVDVTATPPRRRPSGSPASAPRSSTSATCRRARDPPHRDHRAAAQRRLLRQGPRAEVLVEVPVASGLDAKVGSSDVASHGRFDDTRVDAGSGDISLDVVDGDTVVQSGSGDLVAEHLAGEARVKTGSGDVRRAPRRLQPRRHDRQRGRARRRRRRRGGHQDRVRRRPGRHARRRGRLHHRVGDLVVGEAASGRVTAKTASGDVRIGVRAGTPVWTDVRTASGRLSSSLPSTGEPAADQPYLEVRATTASGDVTLHQS